MNKTDVRGTDGKTLLQQVRDHITTLVLIALVASAAALGYLYGGTEALHSTVDAIYIPLGALLGAIGFGAFRFIAQRSI